MDIFRELLDEVVSESSTVSREFEDDDLVEMEIIETPMKHLRMVQEEEQVIFNNESVLTKYVQKYQPPRRKNVQMETGQHNPL